MVESSVLVMCSVMANGHMWQLSIWNVATVTEGLIMLVYLILIQLNSNNHIVLMATILNSSILDMLKIAISNK